MSRQPLVHGSRHGYEAWKCRCAPCVDAYRASERQRYHEKRRSTLPAVRRAKVFTARPCKGCDTVFLPTGGHQPNCPTCVAHHGQHAVPMVSHPYNVRVVQDAAPASSWWLEADPTSFTKTAQAEHLTRMRYSRFGQGASEVVA